MFSNPRHVGILQVLLAGIFFGHLGLFGKAAYAHGVSAGELLALRFLTGSLLMALFQYARLGRPGIIIDRRGLGLCALLGIAGYALFSMFYFAAIKGLSASIAVLLLYTFPLWVALGAWLWLGEAIPRHKLLVIPLTICGLVALLWGEFAIQGVNYVVLGSLSAILYAIYILISRRYLQRYDAMTCVLYIQLFAGLALLVTSFSSIARILAVIDVFAWQIALMALICGVGAMGLFQAGLQKIRSWEASLLSTSEPLTAIALAEIFLGERMGAMQIIGGLLIIAAFVFMAVPDRRRP